MLAVALILAACSGSPLGGGSGSATPYALPPDATPYHGPTRPVTGLDATPGPTHVDQTRALGPPPPSQLPAWDGTSVILYNLKTGERIDLGPGRITVGSFAGGAGRFAWLVGPSSTVPMGQSPAWGTARVIDLATRQQRDYGRATNVGFGEPGQLFVASAHGFVRIDLATGATATPTFATFPPSMHYPGYIIEPLHPAATPPTGGNAGYLIVPDDGSPALTAQAAMLFAVPGGRAVLALVRESGSVYGLFRVDVPSARATPVAWADFDGYDYPLGLASDEIAIGDRLCHDDGRIFVYHFDSERLDALRTNLPPVTINGNGFGVDGGADVARARINPTSLDYSTVLPTPGVWSPDGTWAAVGPTVYTRTTPSPCGTPKETPTPER